MAYWTGLILFLIGAGFLWSALARRARVKAEAAAAAARGEPAGPPPLHPSLALMGEIGPPIITFGLVVAGGQMILAYMATGGAGFTLVDLIAFLFLLVAYDIWVRMRTRYRPALR